MQVDVISSYQLQIIFILRITQLTVGNIFWWTTMTVLLSKMECEVIFDYLDYLSLIIMFSILVLFKLSEWTRLLPLMMLRISRLRRFLRLRIFIDVLIHDYLNIYSC